VTQVTETRKADTKPIAHSIDHPALHALQITDFVLQAITFPEFDQSFDGAIVVRFKCVEHVKPDGRSATKTADGSGVKVDEAFRSNIQPKNDTPPKPSTVKRARSPKGQPTPPASGSD